MADNCPLSGVYSLKPSPAGNEAAVARYERGTIVPDVRTLARLVEGCGFRLVLGVAERTGRTGDETAIWRPPAIPHDLADPSVEKADGVVELPLHVQWSGRRSYDLSDRADRSRAYELVLWEGTEDDVRRFVRLDALEELWDDLLLPAHVRTDWDRWLAAHRTSRSEVTRIRLATGFVRLAVEDGEQATVVDLASDYRLRPSVATCRRPGGVAFTSPRPKVTAGEPGAPGARGAVRDEDGPRAGCARGEPRARPVGQLDSSPADLTRGFPSGP